MLRIKSIINTLKILLMLEQKKNKLGHRPEAINLPMNL